MFKYYKQWEHLSVNAYKFLSNIQLAPIKLIWVKFSKGNYWIIGYVILLKLFRKRDYYNFLDPIFY